MHTYDYSLKGTDDYLVVTYSYSPSEPTTWEEPGCPSDVEIESITCNGVDITEIISVPVFTEILEATLISHEESAYENKISAQIDRWEADREDRFLEDSGY